MRAMTGASPAGARRRPGLGAWGALLCVAAHVWAAAPEGRGPAGGDGPFDPQTLRVLAEQGDKRAAFLLGTRFASGRGSVRDDSEAARWFRLAAEGGLAEAQYNLGVLYATGRGVPRDLAQAAAWYRRAAEQGLAEAQYNLGTLHASGRGVSRDEAVAARWLEQAARKGVAQAQYNLAALYEHGRGVRLDAHRALEWYQRAAEQGFAPARDRHAALTAKLAAPAPVAVRQDAGTAPPGAVEASRGSGGAPSPGTAAAAPGTPSGPAPGGTRDPDAWVAGLDPKAYTLQLASYAERADAERFAARFPAGTPVGIYSATKRGRRWYAVVHGSYPDYEQAAAAVETLPAQVRRMRPWVRKVSLIHAEMR